MEPLELLFEQPGLHTFDLPDELGRLYGGGLGLATPCLFANFVSTVDGVVAFPRLERSSTIIAAGSEGDRFVMGLLRACAHAVLLGSSTLRASPTSLWRAAGPFPGAADAYAELRRRLGHDTDPVVAIVTGGANLPMEHPRLEDGALVLTTETAASKLRARLPGASEIIPVCGGDRVDPGSAVQELRSRGLDLILSESGPTFFGSLLDAGLVDELFLTISPLLGGRSHDGQPLSLIEGVDLLPTKRVGATVLSARRQGSHLFLRYGVQEAAVT